MGHEYGHGLAVSSSGTSTREEFFQVHSEAFLPCSPLHRQYTNGCLLLHSQRRISPALVYKGKVLFNKTRVTPHHLCHTQVTGSTCIQEEGIIQGYGSPGDSH